MNRIRSGVFSQIGAVVVGLVLLSACAAPEEPIVTSKTLAEGWSLQAAAPWP